MKLFDTVLFVLGGILVGVAIAPDHNSCPKSVFYMEPRNVQPQDWVAADYSEGSTTSFGKKRGRILEKSLIGGPWENQ